VHVNVVLTSGDPLVTLGEPTDCTRFDVVVHGQGDDAALDRALASASVGVRDKDEVLVSVAAVRRLAAPEVGAGWEADFTAMLDYAAGRGWLTDDASAIRAHVEWH